MKQILLLISVFFLQSATVAGPHPCVCEIGREPKNQQSFFRSGCKRWLKDQKNCTETLVQEFGADFTKELHLSEVLTLRIGYVGHWNSAYEMKADLIQRFEPLLQQSHASIWIDNTACRSMDKPFIIFDYLHSLRLAKNQEIKIRGNQVMSVGKWDDLLGSHLNLTAEVSNLADEVRFPKCKQFQNYACLQSVQLHEVGLCLDNQGQIQTLTCCKTSSLGGGETETQEQFLWSRPQDCASP